MPNDARVGGRFCTDSTGRKSLGCLRAYPQTAVSIVANPIWIRERAISKNPIAINVPCSSLWVASRRLGCRGSRGNCLGLGFLLGYLATSFFFGLSFCGRSCSILDQTQYSSSRDIQRTSTALASWALRAALTENTVRRYHC